MAWLGLKLLGIGRALLGALGALWKWLLAEPVRLVLLVLFLHIGAHAFVVDPRLRDQRDEARAQATQLRADLGTEKAAHRRTKQKYRAAQAEAARLEQARLDRVKTEQQEITDEVAADYARRLADARALAERLRGEVARAGKHPSGPPGDLGVPGTGDASGRTDGPPADRGLSLDERLVATEQALQLDALIDWIERQGKVQVNEAVTP